ncbi:hypothetical protein SDC9_171103 [bioreactor metagenome]|uniref:Uncharacterized protein n=1 Tax=bioreactor metagenome TaxID=1076179 RepID=A0A645GCB2_9ZZZZ
MGGAEQVAGVAAEAAHEEARRPQRERGDGEHGSKGFERVQQRQRQQAEDRGNQQFGRCQATCQRLGFAGFVFPDIGQQMDQAGGRQARQRMRNCQGKYHAEVVLDADLDQRHRLRQQHQHQADGAVTADA